MLLKEARFKKQLSQKEVGDLIGLEQGVYSRYERMKLVPNFLTLCKIKRLLNLKWSELENEYKTSITTRKKNNGTRKTTQRKLR